MSVVWTIEMIDTLKTMRAIGVPLYECAERIGVGYATAVHKARELRIANRMNHGRLPGWAHVTPPRHHYFFDH